ncbi:tripartite tricarboxylate transporter substrate-binding protein, partial [Bordetella bronchiseptica]|uniref:tripartite tricarboxylate transporter substrate-binding protein n=1 Tax=Bordetella bronchiseptica TaxID=518 RepID=UPI0022A8CCB6
MHHVDAQLAHHGQQDGHEDQHGGRALEHRADEHEDQRRDQHAEELRKDLGANVIVENKPGAQGLIGTEYAVRQPGDGYTLTIASSSLNSINPGLF